MWLSKSNRGPPCSLPGGLRDGGLYLRILQQTVFKKQIKYFTYVNELNTFYRPNHRCHVKAHKVKITLTIRSDDIEPNTT